MSEKRKETNQQRKGGGGCWTAIFTLLFFGTSAATAYLIVELRDSLDQREMAVDRRESAYLSAVKTLEDRFAKLDNQLVAADRRESAYLSAVKTLEDRFAKLDNQLVQTLGTMLVARDTSNSDAVKPGESNSLQVEIQRPSSILPFINGYEGTKTAKGLANSLAEVDSWIFSPHEETEANQIIDSQLAVLRERITSEVKALDRQAVVADSGQQALLIFSEGSSLLELFPASADQTTMKGLSELLLQREETIRRIQELRRLRYRKWALSQIELGFEWFHRDVGKLPSGEADDDKLVDTTTKALVEVDPESLDVVTMELYMSLIRAVNDSISERHRIQLAKQLSDPIIPKRHPELF